MKDLKYYMALNYPRTLEQDEDGVWAVRYPDLPGCIGCGDTLEEGILMGEDARQCWISTALKDNDFVPEPHDPENCMEISVPISMYKQLSKKARAKNMTTDRYCQYILADALAPPQPDTKRRIWKRR